MKTIQEKRLDFINTQFQPYIDNPSLRAIDSDECVYYNETTGNKCIIGKQIPQEFYNNNLEGSLVEDNRIFNLLPDNIKELGKDFLSDMQSMHDGPCYWYKTLAKFTKYGEYTLKKLIKEYCTNV